SAIMYMVYGLGACVGPLIAGFLMRSLQAGVFFVFVTACAIFLVILVRPQRVSGTHLSQDAPTEFVPMPDSVQNPNVVPALDPRVDLDSDVSFVTPTAEELETAPLETEAEAAETVAAEAMVNEETVNGLSPAASVDGAAPGTGPAELWMSDEAEPTEPSNEARPEEIAQPVGTQHDTSPVAEASRGADVSV